MEKIFNHLKRKFVTGLFILIPLGITIFILKFLFNFADGILGPYIEKFFEITLPNYAYLPGLGMITGAIVVYVTGVIASNVLGKTMLHWWERILERIPLVKSIYTSSKQLINVFKEGKTSYRKAVFVDWPRTGVKAIGFVTAEFVQNGEKYVVVYIPTMPNPTSGFALFFRENEVMDSGMTVEEAVKFVVSGGMVLPT